jgi:S-methylmethionine-dependent homocysteine/selenocysteine methylase
VEDPEAVRQLHREFLRAGSDVMQVPLINTYKEFLGFCECLFHAIFVARFSALQFTKI